MAGARAQSPSRLPLRGDGGESSEDCEAGGWEEEWRGGAAPPAARSAHRRGLWLAAAGTLAALAAVFAAATAAARGRPTGEQLGLPGAANVISFAQDPYDCVNRLSDWEDAWSEAKQRWCCSHKGLGCPQINHAGITFVLSNIKFQDITSAAHKDVLAKVLAVVLTDISDQAQNEVKPSDVSLAYWEGSATGATLGMVVRASMTVEKKTQIKKVLANFEEEDFKAKVAEDVGNLDGIKDVSVPPISVQALVMEHPPSDNCTCDHGLPQDGDACPAMGGQVCKECYGGFHLTSSALCVPNECSCPNGYKATGELCDKHLSTKCSSCMMGHHMDSDAQTACLPNKCTCEKGTGATGRACYMDQGSICADCDKGFHVDRESWSCEANVCECEFGIPARGEDCSEDGANICQACELGFHVTQFKQCERNTCTCESGEAALGRLCERDGASVCTFCHDGLHLHTDGTCGEKQCVCPNGVGATGDACEEHRGTQCVECDEGYHLNGHQCLNAGCACTNGVAASGYACFHHVLYAPQGPSAGANLCDSCHPGHTLVDGACQANVCTCEHGEPAQGAGCYKQGANACGKCEEGYHGQLLPVNDTNATHFTRICIENVCTCQHNGTKVGTPADLWSWPKCAAEGNLCTECTATNYHLGSTLGSDNITIDNQCLPNVCTCTGGQPVGAGKCPEEGMEFCEVCDDGFFNTTAVLTEYEKDLGSDPPDASNYRDGAMLCVNSAFTTTLPFECTPTPKDWEATWSTAKKHWCCKELGIGCIPTATEEVLCGSANTTDNQTQCELVGCCKWSEADGKCGPAEAPDRVCHPMFNIKTAGKCLTANNVTEDGDDPKIGLKDCDFKNAGQDWAPLATGQIKDLDGRCLQVKPDEVMGSLTYKTCSSDAEQVFVRDANSMQLRSKKGFCITAQGAAVLLEACAATNPSQQWIVPAVNR